MVAGCLNSEYYVTGLKSQSLRFFISYFQIRNASASGQIHRTNCVLQDPWTLLGWGLKGTQIVLEDPPLKVNECNRLLASVDIIFRLTRISTEQ